MFHTACKYWNPETLKLFSRIKNKLLTEKDERRIYSFQW